MKHTPPFWSYDIAERLRARALLHVVAEHTLMTCIVSL